MQINIHKQIYQWREVMDDHGQFSNTKKAAMKIAGKVLSHPHVFRAAAESGMAALKVLPHFALYNRLNAWGRHRDIPRPATETFHQWWARTRGGNGQATPTADTTPGPEQTHHVGA